MASRYEYQVIDLNRNESPDGMSEAERISAILNEHGARGWELDRFFEMESGVTRLLLRKVTNRSMVDATKLSVFS